MAVDYDLVIVGETLEAREAAAIAAQQGARVALVLSPNRLQSLYSLDLLSQVLTQWGNRIQQSSPEPGEPASPAGSWLLLKEAVEMAAAAAYPDLTPAALAMQGVDVVTAPGYFSPKPRLAFTIEQRTLTARAYLIACGSHIGIPAIPGLAETPYLKLEDLLHLDRQPQKLVILGRAASAIALAQTFASLGTEVTLISRGDQLLPNEDPEVSQFIETLLTASGVTLRLGAQVERIEPGASGVSVQAQAGQMTTADHLLIATGPQPATNTLNLDRVGVKQTRSGLQVDEQLRTTHPRIFAAGSVLGGLHHGAVARHEAHTALHNALYLPTRKVSWRQLPYSLGTTPELGCVGLTEREARQQYGSQVQAFSMPISASVKAHLLATATGFCKLVAHQNGTLLGASLIGPQAGELVQGLALLIDSPQAMTRIAAFPAIPYTLTELLMQTAQQWQQQRWQPGQWRRDWAENWFNWRRSSR